MLAAAIFLGPTPIVHVSIKKEILWMLPAKDVLLRWIVKKVHFSWTLFYPWHIVGFTAKDGAAAFNFVRARTIACSIQSSSLFFEISDGRPLESRLADPFLILSA